MTGCLPSALELSRKSIVEGNRMVTKLLDRFSQDLTQKVSNGECMPVIGREQQMEQMIQILCRKTKNNPALVGRPGVGKNGTGGKAGSGDRAGEGAGAAAREATGGTVYVIAGGWNEIPRRV